MYLNRSNLSRANKSPAMCSSAMNKFTSLFGRRSSVVLAMIHVPALPGTPQAQHSMEEILDITHKEAKIYSNAHVDGIIIENCHDVPYLHRDSIGPELTAYMTAVASNIRRSFKEMPMGIQILAGANREALAVAHAAGLNFIRAEGFVFSHVADEGIMNACAGELLRYRKQIGADHVLVFTDIKKKHSAHAITHDVGITETAKAAEFFLSNGVIVTGSATGEETSPAEVKEVQQGVSLPVLVGSGVTIDNVSSYIHANALIVGSHFKKGGDWRNDVDPVRVKEFMSKINGLRE